MNKTAIQLLTTAFIVSTISLVSCHHVKEKAKETLNKGGEVVGQTATEVLEGVSQGVDQSLQCEVVLSEAVKVSGITNGAFHVNSDSSGGHNNLMEMYLIFATDFSGRLNAKVYNSKGLESGRCVLDVTAKAGSAGYYDFRFDGRTEIESKSRFVIDRQLP